MTIKEALEHLDAARIEWSGGYAYQKPRFEALDMAIDALKAQEPRVMTWQDVIGAVIQCKPLYVEMKDIDCEEPGANRWAMMTQYGDSLTNGMICAMSSYITRETLFKSWYNKTWRCWTARPTDEQREATLWE